MLYVGVNMCSSKNKGKWKNKLHVNLSTYLPYVRKQKMTEEN